MNVPGSAEGHWGWRVEGEQLSSALAARLRDLTEESGRLLQE